MVQGKKIFQCPYLKQKFFCVSMMTCNFNFGIIQNVGWKGKQV